MDEYDRQRLFPRPGDPFYLHLSDLRLAIEEIRTEQALDILDFGAGTAPYRSLFPGARYRTADIPESGTAPDHTIGRNSVVDVLESSFDLVLSTQVLEHVPGPSDYLTEAGRLLRPGGFFFCTTHGSFPDHDYPGDYHRWTPEGLKDAMRRSALDTVRVSRLTTNLRASLFFLELTRRARVSATDGFGQTISSALTAIDQRLPEFHQWCDDACPKNRVVPAEAPGHDIYVGLAILARRSA